MARTADRAIFRKQKRCLCCGQKPLASKTKCQRCLVELRERYHQRKQAGICVQCGSADAGVYARCAPCRALMQQYWRTYMRKKREAVDA